MLPYQQTIQSFQTTITTILRKTFNLADLEVVLETPKSREHGDFAINTAMKLVKVLGKNPRMIAQEIVAALQDIDEIVSLEIAGPGFVNITLVADVFLDGFAAITKSGVYAKPLFDHQEKTIIVEYPSSNAAKPLAVHHLLSAIIGQSFADMASKLGYKVMSINHLGDWGTQFGKILYAYKNFDHGFSATDIDIMALLHIYQDFCAKEKEDESLTDHARSEFLALEQGDETNQKLWKHFIDVSVADVEKVLGRLGHMKIDKTMGESFYSEMMEPIVQAGIEKNIFTESRGSLVCEFPDEKYPLVLIKKSDGATLYITRDLATAKYRRETWNPHEVVYVVDVAQKLHFQQIFEISQMLGTNMDGFMHVPFGRMSFKDGTKMSTRSGNVLLLDAVIDEAIERSMVSIESFNPELPEDEKNTLAHMMGVGALKYNILSQNIRKNFGFDWDTMLSLEGNSAPYLQYAHARAKSVLRKADVSFDVSFDMSGYTLHLKEKLLLRKILDFPEIVERAYSEKKTNVISNYLFEMTQNFNSFYDACSVLNADSSDQKHMRLVMVEQFALTLKEGLLLLGIDVPEVM